MAFNYADRVKETTTTTGTGTITLGGAVTDYRSFSSAIAVGDVVAYCIEDTVNHAWEVGMGTLVTSGTLSRDTVLSSSNSNALVTFAAGTKSIFCTLPGSRLLVPEGSGGTPAPAQTLELFQKNVAGRRMLAMVGPSGLDTSLQPLMGRNRTVLWNPIGNATTVPTTFGIGAPTAMGTATARAVNTTNIVTRMKRLGFVSATTASSMAGLWNPTAITQFTTGTGSGLGGFTFIARYNVSDTATVANARMFVGMSSSVAAATNVDPATLTNSFGVAQLNGQTNLHIVYGGSVAQTAINLGANFPAAVSTDAYDVAFFASPNSTDIGYTITRLGTGASTSGVLSGTSAFIPQSGTLLGPRLWRTNSSTTLAVGIDISSIYLETDL
jgi:hypothetical protein